MNFSEFYISELTRLCCDLKILQGVNYEQFRGDSLHERSVNGPNTALSLTA